MKILIIMSGFFPGKKYGGPPVSVRNFCYLMNDFECYIVTKNHDLGEKNAYEGINDGWNSRENYKICYLNDGEYKKNTFEEIICDIKPDVIYLQGLFQSCILPCLLLAKKYKIGVVLAPRGELCKGAFRKKYKKIPYIFLLRVLGVVKCVQFQSTSAEETEAIHKYLRVTYDSINTLTNIPSLPEESFDEKNKKTNSAQLVFLSRIHPKKNLLGAIRALENVRGDVSLHVYGPIEDEIYWKKCEDEILRLPSNIQVKYCGIVSHEDVHKVFSLYDAFLFPTFSENYGHVIAESLIVGCPVIISDQTPWNDVNSYNAGWAIPLSDTDAFTKAIQQIVDCNSNVYRERAKQYIVEKLDFDKMHSAYKNVFQKCINSKK